LAIQMLLGTLQLISTPICLGGACWREAHVLTWIALCFRQASWHMHAYIAAKNGAQVAPRPSLPRFYTPVDLVDLSVDICGVTFPNPFGYVYVYVCP
jgi:hypothetical protein